MLTRRQTLLIVLVLVLASIGIVVAVYGFLEAAIAAAICILTIGSCVAVASRHMESRLALRSLAGLRNLRDLRSNVEMGGALLQSLRGEMMEMNQALGLLDLRLSNAEKRTLESYESQRSAQNRLRAEIIDNSAESIDTVSEMHSDLKRSLEDIRDRIVVSERRLLEGNESSRAESARADARLDARVGMVESRLLGAIESLRIKIGELALDLERGHTVSDGYYRDIGNDLAAMQEAFESQRIALDRSVEQKVAQVSGALTHFQLVLDDVIMPIRDLLERDVEDGVFQSAELLAGVATSVEEYERMLEKAAALLHLAVDGISPNDSPPKKGGRQELSSKYLDPGVRRFMQARYRERTTPSFREQYSDMRRQVERAQDFDPLGWHPYRQTKRKLRNYEFARSHGIATPTVYDVWSTVDEIRFDDLPDTFVLKSDFGSSGHGVLLLERRSSGGFFDVLRKRDFSAEEVRMYLRDRIERREIGGPYFAEERLGVAGGYELLDDVKIYTSYGSVLHTLLRRPRSRTANTGIAYRYLGPDGDDLGPVALSRPIDSSIPAPKNLRAMMHLAQHMSRALGTPGCRVDLYDTSKGVVLGELTLTPGGVQVYTPEHDARLGAIWRDAQLRRELDMESGRPFGRLYGKVSSPPLYPEGHVSRSSRPGPWARKVYACEAWCFESPGNSDCDHSRAEADAEPPEVIPGAVRE